MSKANFPDKIETILFESVNVPIQAIDLSTLKVSYANSYTEDLLSIAQEHLVGTRIEELFHEADRKKLMDICELLNSADTGSEAKEYDIKVRKKSGRPVAVNINAASIELYGKKTMVLCLHDISTIKSYQQDREKAIREVSRMSQLAELGQLAAGVAHELNNPLMIIQGFVENMEVILDESNPSMEELRNQISPILQSTQRMARIISQLTRMVRDDEVQFMEADLKDIVKGVLNLMGSQMKLLGVDVRFDAPDSAVVNCDTNRVEQILMNIFNNAIHSLEKVNQNRIIEIKIESVKDAIELTVWNNGPEIPEEIKDKIMTPFFTTKEVGEGTGLGLAVSYGIMKAHGGELRLSDHNSGAGFVLQFPQEGTRHQKLRSPAAKQIMVVDDERFARQVFKKKLESFAYQVIECKTAQEALEKLSNGVEVLCVLTDMKMPRMDGKSFIESVRKFLPEIPVIATSGYLSEELVERELKDLNLTGFLPKPIQHAKLVGLLKTIDPELQNVSEAS